MKKTINLIAALLLVCCCSTSCYTRVDAGHEGIKVNLYGDDKGVDGVELVTGAVWYNGFTTAVYEYPTFVQTVDYESFSFNSQDGSVFTFDPTIMLSIKSGAAPEVFVKYRKELDEILNVTLVPIIQDAFKEEINARKDNDLISKQTEFQNAIEARLAEELGKENFVVSKVTTGIKYPTALVESINAKNKAQQEELRIKNEVLVAEAEVAKKVAIAKGDADALKIQADAEAYYNRTVSASITPTLVNMKALEKWDGKTPVVSGSSGTFIDASKFVK
jgi:regulator of protease activity HflC (stomatin/prohibitin superfamily)